MAHAIEKELIKATGYKAQRKFSDRQDYLGSILNAVIKLSDEDFDNLSDEAAAWFNGAVEVRNASKNAELPDFDEPLPESDEDEGDPTDDNTEADDDGGDAAEDESPDDDDDADDGDGDDEGDDPDASEDAEDDGDDPEPEPAPKPARSKRPPPPAKEKAKAAKADKAKAKPAAKSEGKPKSKYVPTGRPRFGRGEEDVVLDKWGCMEGSKNSQALALFEKGATAKEVKDKLGGTYYNILGKCVSNGHKLEKEGNLMKLTHKDEVGKKSGPAAKPTPKQAAKKK